MGNIFRRGGKSDILLPNDKESLYEGACIYVRKREESLYEAACIYVRKREKSRYERLVAALGKKNPFTLEARGKGLAGRLALRQRRTARKWRRRTGEREAAWLLSEATLVLRGREAVHLGEVTREVARIVEAHLIGNLADATLALAQELLGMAQAYVANEL